MAPDFPSHRGPGPGHVLYVDIVGYSKLLINEQTDRALADLPTQRIRISSCNGLRCSRRDTGPTGPTRQRIGADEKPPECRARRRKRRGHLTHALPNQ